jgi:hypothetical protein
MCAVQTAYRTSLQRRPKSAGARSKQEKSAAWALPGSRAVHACALTGRTCLRSNCPLASYVTEQTHLLSAFATRATSDSG